VFCPQVFRAALFTVTPETGVIVTTPAPICSTVIIDPVGNATEEFNGTFSVIGLALLQRTRSPRSVKARVKFVDVESVDSISKSTRTA
jgi:hypothetical protein